MIDQCKHDFQDSKTECVIKELFQNETEAFATGWLMVTAIATIEPRRTTVGYDEAIYKV